MFIVSNWIVIINSLITVGGLGYQIYEIGGNTQEYYNVFAFSCVGLSVSTVVIIISLHSINFDRIRNNQCGKWCNCCNCCNNNCISCCNENRQDMNKSKKWRFMFFPNDSHFRAITFFKVGLFSIKRPL